MLHAQQGKPSALMAALNTFFNTVNLLEYYMHDRQDCVTIKPLLCLSDIMSEKMVARERKKKAGTCLRWHLLSS